MDKVKNDNHRIPAADNIPGCTYRLQLHKNLNFAEAQKLVHYLAGLGISHCYTSPFFKARPGSSHGYDVVDPNSFNPEIGDKEAFDAFVRELHSRGLFLLVDLVPNHMGVMGADNTWWLDVLENGPASVYSSFFDIDWNPQKKSLKNRILVPVLGDHYGRELENGELQLFFAESDGFFAVRYFEHLFPLDPRTYPMILQHKLADFSGETGINHPEYRTLEHILELCSMMPGRTATSPAKKQERHRTGAQIKKKLQELAGSGRVFPDYLSNTLKQLNGTPGQRRSFIGLHQLLERQAFRLSYWKVAAEEINYRRFFDINDLAGLRVEREDVFTETHRLLFKLVSEGAIEGVRIDHIDGLYDPAGYLRRLQERLRSLLPERQLYLVVEKILERQEELPRDWQTHGTTGYDFGAQVNGLFIDGTACKAMNRTYEILTGTRESFEQVLLRSKKHILRESLTSELNTLANRLMQLAETDWQSRDFTYISLRQSLIELVASFPVYRTYIVGRRISETDRQAILAALELAKQNTPDSRHNLLDFLTALLLQQRGWQFRRMNRKAVHDFTMRLQQLTAPVTAKGLEDTALYRFNRLVSQNEVGDTPARFGVSRQEFHQACFKRLADWPHAMLTTSTHDSKHSEDVRARLNVLSEMAVEWKQTVKDWHRMNRRHRHHSRNLTVPDGDMEYLLYQNLLGIWPLAPPDRSQRQDILERLENFALKAAREAKLATSWRNPDEQYEKALLLFIRNVFADQGSKFWQDFMKLHGKLAWFGLYNSLGQVLLKMTVPGVPDIYQGCELWNFSLVDPDNRRPVDFSLRQQMLEKLKNIDPAARVFQQQLEKMRSDMTDGYIKLYITQRCLALRRQLPDLFNRGSYLPLKTVGTKSEHVISFMRYHENRKIVVVVPRFIYTLTGGDSRRMSSDNLWQDTAIEVSPGTGSSLVSILTGKKIVPEKFTDPVLLPIAEALDRFPVELYTISQT